MTWVDGAIPNPPPAAKEAVRLAQNQLRVDFPADFLAVAKDHQGAAPQPAKIALPNGFTTAVAHLFHFESTPFISNIVGAWLPVQKVLDKGIIPFAADVGGDLFCFSYRQDYDNPPVVFWGVDFGVVPLAPSFTEFVALLRD